MDQKSKIETENRTENESLVSAKRFSEFILKYKDNAFPMVIKSGESIGAIPGLSKLEYFSLKIFCAKVCLNGFDGGDTDFSVLLAKRLIESLEKHK